MDPPPQSKVSKVADVNPHSLIWTLFPSPLQSFFSVFSPSWIWRCISSSMRSHGILKSNLVLMFICYFHCSLGGNCMTSMIATCSLDRKNLDVSCIIIIVIVKCLSSTIFHCCTGMSVQFFTNVVSLRKSRRKHYELCHFDQERIVALNLTSAFDVQKIFLQGKLERT